MKKTMYLLIMSLITIASQAQTTSLNDYTFLDIESDIVAEWGNPVFEDDFSSFNAAYWTSVRNSESVHNAYYTLNNAVISNQSLLLKAKREDLYVSAHKKFYNMTVGEVWTKGNLGGTVAGNNNDGKFQYGYFEIRAKLAKGKGTHSSFWLFGNTDGEGHELDVFEASHYGRPPGGSSFADKGNSGTGNQHATHFGTNLHRFVDGSDLAHPHHFGIPNLNNGVLSDGFNVYAVEWTPQEITWYFNNREIRRVKSSDLLQELGVSSFHPMRLVLSLGYDNRLDNDSPLESQMEIKNVKVYQKSSYKKAKPEIIGNTVVCGSPANMRFTASNYGFGDRFKWKVIDGNGYIFQNQDSNADVYVNFNSGKRTMTLRLTVTDPFGGSTSRTVVITNRRDPYFFIDEHTCQEASGKTSLKLLANTPVSGSEWTIYKCDEAGNHTSGEISRGWGVNTYTFNELDGNTYYRIYHGVWESYCSSWSQASRIYHTSLLRSFDIKWITRTPFYYEFSGLAHSKSQSTNHYWALHSSDANGTLGTQLGSGQSADSVRFSNLGYGYYFIIRHGVWNSCNSWKESRRLIYIPGYTMRVSDEEYNLTTDPSGIEVKVFPNPVVNEMTVSSDKDIIEILLYTIDGKLLNEYKVGSTETTLDCSYLQSGEYFLLIVNADSAETKKIVVSR